MIAQIYVSLVHYKPASVFHLGFLPRSRSVEFDCLLSTGFLASLVMVLAFRRILHLLSILASVFWSSDRRATWKQ